MTGRDANDIMREEGADALRMVIDTAADSTFDEMFATMPGRSSPDDLSGAAQSGSTARAATKPTVATVLPLIQSSAQFIANFVPPDYLVDGILQRRFVYSLTGKTGAGKTAVLTFLAASVALGRPIGPHEIEKGRVIYFAGENPDDVRMRWIALAQQMAFEPDSDMGVHFIPGVFKISEMMDRIRQEVGELGGGACIIVDTSAAYNEGDDENDNKQMGDHARRFRVLTTVPGGPCVIAACHPPKNAADDNLQPRGGGSFIAEMDGNLTGRKEGAVVELHWQGKFRGPDFAPIVFLLRTVTHERLKDSKGRLIRTVIAEHLSEAAQAELASVTRTRENELLEMLRDNEGASQAELAQLLGWKLRDGQPNKMLVNRTLQSLANARLVTKDRGRYPLTDKGKKAAGPGKSATDADVTIEPKSRRSNGRRNAVTRNGYDTAKTQ